jgi:hypothetical protein
MCPRSSVLQSLPHQVINGDPLRARAGAAPRRGPPRVSHASLTPTSLPAVDIHCKGLAGLVVGVPDARRVGLTLSGAVVTRSAALAEPRHDAFRRRRREALAVVLALLHALVVLHAASRPAILHPLDAAALVVPVGALGRGSGLNEGEGREKAGQGRSQDAHQRRLHKRTTARSLGK